MGIRPSIDENLLGRAERRLGIEGLALSRSMRNRAHQGVSLTESIERAGEAQSHGPPEEQPQERAGEEWMGKKKGGRQLRA